MVLNGKTILTTFFHIDIQNGVCQKRVKQIRFSRGICHMTISEPKHPRSFCLLHEKAATVLDILKSFFCTTLVRE